MASSVMATPTVVNIGKIGDSASPLFQCNFLNTGDQDPSGVYTSAKDWDQQAIDATVRSLQTWDTLIKNEPGRTLSVGLIWQNLGTGILGGAFSQFYTETYNNYEMISSTVEKVWKEGQNYPNYGDYDIYVLLNTQSNFYYGEATLGGAYTGAYDYQTVLTHEIGHTVGFISYSEPIDGTVTFQPDDYGQITYTALDSLMTNADGVNLIDEENGVNGIKLGDTIALEGSELTIYNPDVWAQGSSLSHIDIEEIGGQASDILMRNVLNNDLSVRTLSYEEMLLMQSMGWDMNFAAIPEPATVSLSLMGLAAMMMRRRRK